MMLDSGELWRHIVSEAQTQSQREPLLAALYQQHIFSHETFDEALAYLLAQYLSEPACSATVLYKAFTRLLTETAIVASAVEDIRAHYERDPACDNYLTPFLYFKGFQAVQAYRLAHHLWLSGRTSLALYIQYRSSVVFDVDIHPGAVMGHGIMIDHATGVVIGETAVIGNNVSLLHAVTLGGSGCGKGVRHPQIADGVLISAGAKVLGNVTIGEGAKIAAGSVVLTDVPAHTTVAGVPAKPVGKPASKQPALEMDHRV